jgi:hypothetical protein
MWTVELLFQLRAAVCLAASATHSSYFSTTVIVGFALVLLMNTILFPEIRIAVVLVPKFPAPFAEIE